MKTKWIAAILLALTIGIVGAVVLQTYNLTETAIVPIDEYGSIIEIREPLTVDWILLEEPYIIPWGSVGSLTDITTYNYDIRITNLGNVKFTVVFVSNIAAKYPTWSEAWDLTDLTVEVGTYTQGVLTLTVPVDPPAVTYEWTSTIDCIEAP